MDWYDYMISAARQSRYHAGHWFRYLRKVIFENHAYLTEEDVTRLLNSGELTDFQKVSLKFAMKPNSPTHDYVVSLNKPAQLSHVKDLLARYGHG